METLKPMYQQGSAVCVWSPLSRWFGGKFYQAKKIVPLICKHYCYVEPFAGAGWVYFKKQASPFEVLNDINADIVNLWQIIVEQPQYLCRKLQYALPCRKIFEDFRDMDEEEITSLSREEQAWRMFYLLKLAHDSKNVNNATAHNKRLAKRLDVKLPGCTLNIRKYDPKVSPYPDFCQNGIVKKQAVRVLPVAFWQDVIRGAHERLTRSSTAIECMPWQKCLKMYDSPETFFYLDPPYLNYLDAYGADFSEADCTELAQTLHNLRGRFILSFNDCPKSRQLFDGFRIHLLPVTYAITNSNKKTGTTNCSSPITPWMKSPSANSGLPKYENLSKVGREAKDTGGTGRQDTGGAFLRWRA